MLNQKIFLLNNWNVSSSWNHQHFKLKKLSLGWSFTQLSISVTKFSVFLFLKIPNVSPKKLVLIDLEKSIQNFVCAFAFNFLICFEKFLSHGFLSPPTAFHFENFYSMSYEEFQRTITTKVVFFDRFDRSSHISFLLRVCIYTAWYF